ncbi:hypothetical protein HID58_019063 [Brassica napus]|uniref:TOPLESS zinc finger domain-containing protein n=1 Tax=Brassica napus TaxID=3708 RepID=A0ABQ8DBS5_BRANA|nr:hypothetical protein HID58_019063 [Brassica napus]
MEEWLCYLGGELDCGSSGDVNAAEARCGLNRLQDVLMARQAKTEPKMEAIPMSAAVTLRLSRITGRTVAAPPLGPPPAPRLWLASECAASEFPTLRSSRLRTLINQSLNWQHQLCKNPRPNPTTHCAVPNGPLALLSVNQPVTTLTKPTAFPLLGAHGVRNLNPFPPVTVVSAANAPTGPVYRKVWYNHLILPYYHLVRLKLTLEKSWDYDQHFHANMILDSKRKDNSFKTGKNNDNRSYDY